MESQHYNKYYFVNKAKERILATIVASVLLCTTLKLTTKIISQKITSLLQIAEEQQGFRSRRSCNDAVFVIRQKLRN